MAGASHAYVGAKSRVANQCGFNSTQHTPSELTFQDGVPPVSRGELG
jgi:5,10-methylene-tetrahydrofolate dehydrogenase/methenyl tetrahydrofolate cyclohydrolase